MSIFEVNKGGYAVGSGAYSVFNKNIKTELNDHGEYHYVFKKSNDLEVASCVCAMTNSRDNETTVAEELYGAVDGIKHNPTIGYYSELYAGYVEEGDYRLNGSSGGLTTWILIELLRNKKIDGVIHVKATNDGPVLFSYAISRTEEEIRAGAKSRYYPAEYSKVINEIAGNGEKFALVGIPSLLFEMQLLLKYIPSLRNTIVYTIGLICGHQKSTKYAECIAWECGIAPGNLRHIDFRKKIANEPSNRYAIELQGVIDGEEVTIVKKQNELFISDWGHGFFKKKFSDYTDDVFNETADVSLGDAWLPDYVGDSKGNNIVIVRSPYISDMIKEGIRSKRINLDLLEAQDVIDSQSGLVRHAHNEIGYRILKRKRAKEWCPSKRFSGYRETPFLRRRIQDVREKIALSSHKKYKDAVDFSDFYSFKNSMRIHIFNYRLLYLLSRINEDGFIWFLRSIKKKISMKHIRK